MTLIQINSTWFELIWFILLLLYNTIIVFVSLLILLEKRSSAHSLSWLLALIFLPGIGLLFFLLFGRNLRRKKKIKLKYDRAFSNPGSEVLAGIPHTGKRKKDLLFITRLLQKSSSSILRANNSLHFLFDYSKKILHLTREIKKARSYIFLEYYIFEMDLNRGDFLEILKTKAQTGVEVRILLDDIGSWGFSSKMMASLRACGVKIETFMPVFSLIFGNRMNYRNHRKIAIIDGKVAYLGGMNLSKAYFRPKSKKNIWSDVHLELQGEVIQDLLTVFVNDWNFASRDKIQSSDYNVPEISFSKKCFLQIISSGPNSQWAGIQHAFFSAINTARDYIYISTPYFSPDESIIFALCTTALAGVDVKIILPKKSDSWLVDLGNLSFVEELQSAGVEILFFEKGLNHGKYMLIDDYFANIGSANLDHRSLYQNFEINAMIYNKQEVKILKNLFQKELQGCLEADVKDSGLLEKISISLAKLLSPIL